MLAEEGEGEGDVKDDDEEEEEKSGKEPLSEDEEEDDSNCEEDEVDGSGVDDLVPCCGVILVLVSICSLAVDDEVEDDEDNDSALPVIFVSTAGTDLFIVVSIC